MYPFLASALFFILTTIINTAHCCNINPFRIAVPFWGQPCRISSSLSPKRDCGPNRVVLIVLLVYLQSVLKPIVRIRIRLMRVVLLILDVRIIVRMIQSTRKYRVPAGTMPSGTRQQCVVRASRAICLRLQQYHCAALL